MKIPQKPKSIKELRKRGKYFELASSLYSQLKDEYLHWDELRRQPPPEDLDHENWWLVLKAHRSSNLRSLPLKDSKGRSFAFAVPGFITEKLHQIDRGAGSIIGSTEPITNPQTRDRYIVSSLVEESITSSQLEGAVTTREVAKDMLTSGRQPRNRSEQMILNNYKTMQFIRTIQNEPLTSDKVLEIHRQVTEYTVDKPDGAGRLRKPNENIHVFDNDGNVVHTPPAAEELSARLDSMCLFASGKTPDYFIHPVIRAILLHFWLAYDHPFVDGNGRTARALFYWSMLHQKYWLFEFISISQILVKAPSEYARSFLYTETDDNDVTYFLKHQSEVIYRSLQALHEFIQTKTEESKFINRLLYQFPDINHRQRDLLAHALRHPGAVYTIAGYQGRHAVVYQTARTDLLNLAKLGFLDQRKSGREWIFIVPQDIAQRIHIKI